MSREGRPTRSEWDYLLNRDGLRWRDAPKEYGPHKTLYNRWKRWSDKGIFAQMMADMAVVAQRLI